MGDDEERVAGPPEAYVPTLSAGETGRIRRWHETAYAMARAEAGGGQTFAYLGRVFDVPPEVRPASASVAGLRRRHGTVRRWAPPSGTRAGATGW